MWDEMRHNEMKQESWDVLRWLETKWDKKRWVETIRDVLRQSKKNWDRFSLSFHWTLIQMYRTFSLVSECHMMYLGVHSNFACQQTCKCSTNLSCLPLKCLPPDLRSSHHCNHYPISYNKQENKLETLFHAQGHTSQQHMQLFPNIFLECSAFPLAYLLDLAVRVTCERQGIHASWV